MTAGVDKEDETGEAKLKELGLTGMHSYGLLDARKVCDADGDEV
jgi:hypothetical protein